MFAERTDGEPHDDGPEPLVRRAVPSEGIVDTDATVMCPHCGRTVCIGLDPGGGATQEYVEDCEVCCRPWRVSVQYDRSGAATVGVDSSD